MGNEYEQTFLQGRHINGQQAHGKMFNVWIREMQIETARTPYFTHTRMTTVISLKQKTTSVVRARRNQHLRGGRSMEPLLRKGWQLLASATQGCHVTLQFRSWERN